MRSFGRDIISLARAYSPNIIKKQEQIDLIGKLDLHIQLFLDHYTGLKITGIQGTTQKKVLNKLKPIFEKMARGEQEYDINEIAKEIEKTYNGFKGYRSKAIARTEAHFLANDGELQAAKYTEVIKQKEWITSVRPASRGYDPSDGTDHIAMNGVKVAKDDKFEVPSVDGFDLMDCPGDYSAPPDQVINCTCVMGFSK